jgi:hypothetical protein
MENCTMKNAVVAVVLVLLAACGGESNSGSGGDSGKVVAGPESCQTYFSEVAAACRDVIHRGLDVSCSSIYMSGSVAASQKKGTLFTDPNGKASVSDMGDAVCASSLNSMRKKIAAASSKGKKAWGPQCTEFFSLLDKTCLAPAAEGDFPQSCSSTLGQIRRIERSEPAEELCGSFSDLIR